MKRPGRTGRPVVTHIYIHCAAPVAGATIPAPQRAAWRVRLVISVGGVSFADDTIVEAAHEVPTMKLTPWFGIRACTGLTALLVITSSTASAESSLRMRPKPRVAQAQPAPTPPPATPDAQPPPAQPAPAPDASQAAPAPAPAPADQPV